MRLPANGRESATNGPPAAMGNIQNDRVFKMKIWLRWMALAIISAGLGMNPLMPQDSQAGDAQTVALVMKALTNPFFSKMEAGARQYAQAKNIPIEVFGVERETDVARQISIVESLITRGVGAIVIAPADSKKLVGICKKAMDKGIVVINIDNPFDRPLMDRLGISIPFIGSDNFIGGQMIGEYVKTKLNGKGRVLVIEGIRGGRQCRPAQKRTCGGPPKE